VAALSLALLLALCACGGNGGGAVEGGAGPAEPAPRSSTTATTRSGAEVAAGAARSVAEVPRQVCGFLGDEVPRLKARGSGLAALARFAADYAGWVGQDANRALSTVGKLDDITTTSCPKLRRQVLDLLDRDSLAKAVGINR
jgi:hypothetical protein